MNDDIGVVGQWGNAGAALAPSPSAAKRSLVTLHEVLEECLVDHLPVAGHDKPSCNPGCQGSASNPTSKVPPTPDSISDMLGKTQKLIPGTDNT